MADNVTADPGSGGAVFATALASWSGDSANFPVGSGGILTGSEGAWTFTLFVGGAGAVTAGVQRMTLASDDPAVTSLGVIDDWDESDRAKVNPIVGQAGVAAGSGVVGATVQRMTLASDDPAVATLGGVSDAAATQGSTGSISAKLRTVTSQLNTIASGIPVTNAGTFAVQAAQSGTWTVTGAGGTFPVTDSAGSLTVDAPVGTPVFVRLSDGASAISTLPVSLASVPSHAVTNAGTFAVQNTTAASGSGMSMYEAVSAASNNAASVKASAGQVYGCQCFNINASPRYLKFFNKATSPTPGSDTVVKSILIPGNSTSGGGCVVKFDPPIEFSTGIAIACVTGIANSDNTSTGASEVILNIDYK